MGEVKDAIKELIRVGQEGDDVATALCNSEASSKAAVRIHLFTLLFEDCHRLCVKLVESTQTMQVYFLRLSLSLKMQRFGIYFERIFELLSRYALFFALYTLCVF